MWNNYYLCTRLNHKRHKKLEMMINSLKYDFLIVGAGLAGSMIAYRAKEAGKSVLVIDKRSHYRKKSLLRREKRVIFCGRLAEYKYYDMRQIVEKTLKMAV